MAAWFDLIQHVEALEERGLTVVTDYHGQGLPKWLAPALGDCDVFVLNVKNVPTDSTLCIVRLARLEQLLAQRDGGIDAMLEQMVAQETAVIDALLAGQDNAELDKLIAEQGNGLDKLLADIEEQNAKWVQTLGAKHEKT